MPQHQRRTNVPGFTSLHCRTLVLPMLALLLVGCAGIEQDGSYHYWFERHYELIVSPEYTYLGKFKVRSDSTTLVDGLPNPINTCSGGYITVEMYFCGNDNRIEEILSIYRETSIKCDWYRPFREVNGRFLTLCSDNNNKYVQQANELAAKADKKLSGCFKGTSRYGYIGQKTFHIVYLFLSEDKIAETGKEPEEALRERMDTAVTLVQ